MAVVFDTAPALAAPSVPPVIDVPPVNGHKRGASLVKLPSNASLPLPVRIWNTRALVLCGLANSKALDNALSQWRGRPVESVRINRDIHYDEKSSQSLVAIWAPDYEGCSIGPIKVVCAASWIKPWKDGDWASYRFMWWHYYGNSPTNSEFKAKVWGIKNELAAVETSYEGSWKSARYLQNGRPALTMAWDTSRVEDAEEDPPGTFVPSRFISVAQRQSDDGQNEVWLRIRRLQTAQNIRFPFDAQRDIWEIDPTTVLGKALGEVSFMPLAWEYLTNYSGVVWITDRNGHGIAPPWPDAPRNGNQMHKAARPRGGRGSRGPVTRGRARYGAGRRRGKR